MNPPISLKPFYSSLSTSSSEPSNKKQKTTEIFLKATEGKEAHYEMISSSNPKDFSLRDFILPDPSQRDEKLNLLIAEGKQYVQRKTQIEKMKKYEKIKELQALQLRKLQEVKKNSQPLLSPSLLLPKTQEKSVLVDLTEEEETSNNPSQQSVTQNNPPKETKVSLQKNLTPEKVGYFYPNLLPEKLNFYFENHLNDLQFGEIFQTIYHLSKNNRNSPHILLKQFIEDIKKDLSARTTTRMDTTVISLIENPKYRECGNGDYDFYFNNKLVFSIRRNVFPKPFLKSSKNFLDFLAREDFYGYSAVNKGELKLGEREAKATFSRSARQPSLFPHFIKSLMFSKLFDAAYSAVNPQGYAKQKSISARGFNLLDTAFTTFEVSKQVTFANQDLNASSINNEFLTAMVNLGEGPEVLFFPKYQRSVVINEGDFLLYNGEELHHNAKSEAQGPLILKAYYHQGLENAKSFYAQYETEPYQSYLIKKIECINLTTNTKTIGFRNEFPWFTNNEVISVNMFCFIDIDKKNIENLYQDTIKEIAKGISFFNKKENKEFNLIEVTSSLMINKFQHISGQDDYHLYEINFSFKFTTEITSSKYETLFDLKLFDQVLVEDLFLCGSSRILDMYLSGKYRDFPPCCWKANWYKEIKKLKNQ